MQMRNIIKHQERVIEQIILEMIYSKKKKVGEVGEVGAVVDKSK